MRLRQARKIDKRMQEHARSPWWERYPLATLKNAAARLHRAWQTHRNETLEGGRRALTLTPDYFMRNRVESFAIRQPLVRQKKPRAPLLKRLGLDRHGVGALARRLRIRHSEACRAQNRAFDGLGYVCSCDFFTIIARAVGRPEAVGARPLSATRMRCRCGATLERGQMGADVWDLASTRFWAQHRARAGCFNPVEEPSPA